MKKLLPILLFAVIVASCNKQDKELPTPVQERKIEKTDCSPYLRVDASKIPARKPGRPNNNVRVTATAFASYFDGRATVVLGFNAKPPISIYRRVVGETSTTFVVSFTKKATQYSDDKARASTSYVYIVNGVESNVVTTFDAPIVGGNEENAVMYLNFEGGNPKGWEGWVSHVGGSGLDDWAKDSIVNVWQREISNKYSFGITVTRDSNIYNATHYSRRQQVIFTEDYEWYGNLAGGVAYLNSWGNELDGIVFTRLLYYDVGYIAFAGGHEGLHPFGLFHAVDFEGQNYSQGPNWMGGAYGYKSEERYLGESVLSNTDRGYILVNQLLSVKNKLGI